MAHNCLIEQAFNKEVLPFLKWAGGKRWLISRYPEIFPRQFDRYVEPFIGGGAVFFQLCPRRGLLADSNAELIETYAALKADFQLVVRYLKAHNKRHSDDYFYTVRAASPRSTYQRAARFIYLNRTCWNALYRVNLNGQFNVPRGTKNSVLLETDNFETVAARLKKVELVHSDFEPIVNSTKSGDFLFVDPPYSVKHNLNGFVKYNKKLFAWEDQIRLKDSLISACNRGVKFLMTNANHVSIRELYGDRFQTQIVTRHSVIAADPNKREKTTEILIFNY